MAVNQFQPDQYLHQLQNDPYQAIAKDKALSLTTYPLLQAFHHWLRKINAIHTPLDVVEETAVIHNEFIYLCEHNFFLFLALIGRFDLIKEFFDGYSFSKEERLLLEDIEREWKIAEQKLSLPQWAPSKPVTSTEAVLPIPLWELYANQLNKTELMHFYEQEILRCRYTHQVEKIHVLQKAVGTRYQLLENAMDIMRLDEEFSPELRFRGEMALAILADNQRQMQILLADEKVVALPIQQKAEKIPDSNKVPLQGFKAANKELQRDLQIVEEKFKQIEKIYADSDVVLQILVEASALDPKIGNLLLQYRKNSQVTQQILLSMDKSFGQRLEVLQKHHQNSVREARTEAIEHVNSFLKAIKPLSTQNLSAEQKQLLVQADLALKGYCAVLRRANTSGEIQAVVQDCAAIMAPIEALSPLPAAKQAAMVCREKLQKFSDEPLKVEPHPPVEPYPEEEETPGNVVYGMEGYNPTFYLNPAQNKPPATSNVEKMVLQNMKKGGPESEEEIDVAEVNQKGIDILKVILGDISSKLEKIKKAASSEDKSKLEEIEGLIKNLQHLKDNKLPLDQVYILNEKLEKISEVYDLLESNTVDLAEFIDNLDLNQPKNAVL